MTLTSSQSTMATVLQGEKPARRPTTTSPPNSRKVQGKGISPNQSLKKTLKIIFLRYSKTQKRNSRAVELTIQVQAPAQYRSSFKATNAIYQTWETPELFCSGSPPRKNQPSNYHTITNQFDLMREKEFKNQEEKFTDLPTKGSKQVPLESGRMKKALELLLLVPWETSKPRESD